MSKERLIFITNDDGVYAEGINALVKGLKDSGRLVVVAPDGPRSGMSSAITSDVPVSVSLLQDTADLMVYSCTGTPADCVKLAINEILGCKPDLLVSGINHGGNQAICVHYSGTMGAVIEGCIFDVPSIGISLADYTKGASFSESVRLGRKVCAQVLEQGLPHGTYLNLNIPNVSRVQGIAVCRQADGQWINEYTQAKDADGKTVYWLGGEFKSRLPIYPDSDEQCLNEGFASLVPGLIDVTDYDFMETLKKWPL
ncbi:MAG: 5'/3'-nucleotidase SurE [Tannerella sp.]|jgi:5'-nucleotidase|nr:5'/3'-nucleotidase SurE [Tannerella sp.]